MTVIPCVFKATNRLKSEQEIAKEEQERLEKLEVHIELYPMLLVSNDYNFFLTLNTIFAAIFINSRGGPGSGDIDL